MPSVELYGRRWHFSTDVMAVPAGLSGVFHAAWILILIAFAGATSAWPGHCESASGVQYVVLLTGLLCSFAANLAVDVLLVYHSLQGAPFEQSKRRWVVPLLYVATVPLMCTLGFTVFGTHVCTLLEPDCWPMEQRNAVTNLTQALVFSTWGFLAVAIIGIAITYNIYPHHNDRSSWEARCECIAGLLCCKANITRRPDGKRAPLTNIAELTAGLLSHCDLDATDITCGLFLAAAAQNRRRRLRIAKALLPVYKALRSTAGSTVADDLSVENEDDDASSISSSVNDVPTDREVDQLVAMRQQSSGAAASLPLPKQDSTVAELKSAAEQTRDGGGGQAPKTRQRQSKKVSWSQDVPDLQTTPPGQGMDTGSLALTEDNVAVLDRRLGVEAGNRPQSTDQGAMQSAAEMVAGDLLAELPAGLPEQHADVLDQLAGAIEEELVELGGKEVVSAETVLEIAKEDSLDLSALQVNPDAPSIWFSTGSSKANSRQMSSKGSELSQEAAGAGELDLAVQSPFYSAGGGTQMDSTAAPSGESRPAGGVVHAAAVEAAAAAATGSATPGPDNGLPPVSVDAAPPPADDAAAAAVAEVAAAAAGSKAATLASESQVRPSMLEKQITLRFPTVITPSEHVDEFRGVLNPTFLADIYAGRHSKVPSSVLREALHFLKFSYSAYSLQPKIEAPASGLDVLGCACCARPTDPQQMIFNAMKELEELEEEGAVELLMVNCSNRVLSHLPYMITLDHTRRAVVLAIRGTISIADLVTDAVVYPEPLDTFLPQKIREELSEPAYAHAGMVGAAKAIFEDMQQRGVLQQLVSDEAVGDFTAPEQQDARRDGSSDPPPFQYSSNYDADAGSSAPGAAQYRVSGHGGSVSSNDPIGTEGPSVRGDAAAHRQQQEQQAGVKGQQSMKGTDSEQMPGRQVGEIMRQKIEDEGWQFIVEGHSLGAGAAALISLKLLDTYPGLKCLAYSCPGGLVSKNLAHAMSCFCTTVVAGKDAVPRSTVANLARLMDEMVTALARCKQPKLKVLWTMLFPSWRMHKTRLSELFHTYESIPDEPREVLHQYYESRASIGQPLSMYPPGRVLFLRPIKTRQEKEFDAVWITPDDLVAEGLLVSPHMLRDHLCSQVYESLTAAAAQADRRERGLDIPELAVEVDARSRVTAAPVPPPSQQPWQMGPQAVRTGSLQQVLIEAS